MPHIYAIGDLHLSHGVSDKAMDVFGSRWQDHTQRLYEAWQDVVEDDALVLIPGDVSWAMYLKDALPDFDFLASLKGEKLLLRGNHDYWWSSYTQVKNALPASIHALQNDVFRFGDVAIAGTRGWIAPPCTAYSETKDRKIFEREKIRLTLSMDALPKDTQNIVMLHYPPFAENGAATEFADMVEARQVQTVVYGHLHGKAQEHAFLGLHNGVQYRLVAADHLQFIPQQIL